MKKLLSDLKVLDLTRLLPGPMCTLYLADLGAEVLKVEDPLTGGDYLRTMEPRLKSNSQGFCHVNRNKKSMTLDLRKKQSQEIFLKLVKNFDVIIESFRPGVMAKMGLDYQKLKETNPKIIYCSLTGYGQTGPLRDEAGHDVNFVSYAGVLQPADASIPPTIPQFQVADLAGGALTAAVSILSAFIHAKKTQEGSYIDVSMLDGVLALTPINLAVSLLKNRSDYFLSGQSPCYQVYETKDGRFMALGAIEEKFWLRFLNLCQRTDLAPLHMPKGEESVFLKEELVKIFKSKTQREWVSLLSKDSGTCCSPVLNYSEALHSDHAKARGLVKKVAHPNEGEVTHIMFPAKFNNEEPEIFIQSPQMGEHNTEVLSSLGYSDAEIRKFVKDKII